MTVPAGDGGGQPAPATGQPAPATGQPVPATGQPVPATGQPAPATGQPATANGDESAAPNASLIGEAATADTGEAATVHADKAGGSAARAGMPVDAGSPAEAGPSVEAVAGDRWSDITAMFVDDPRGSVAEASVMVEEAVEVLIAVARERQASLAASWQAPDADTERLRRALQAYRAFWTTVAQLPQPT